MDDARYDHAGLGFGLDLPEGWNIETESKSSHFPVLVSLRAGDARIMIAARSAAIVDAPTRLAEMQRDLADRGIESVDAGGLRFPGHNVADVAFQIEGDKQRWISMVASGIEFSFTHTGAFDQVHAALEHIAATFRIPDPAHARAFLAARAEPGPFEQAADFANLTHFQKVAARFNVPLPRPPKRKS